MDMEITLSGSVFRDITPVMQHQLEKNMEHEMHVVLYGSLRCMDDYHYCGPRVLIIVRA